MATKVKVKKGKVPSEPKEATLGAATHKMLAGMSRDVVRGVETFRRVLVSLKGEATVPQTVLACGTEIESSLSLLGDVRKDFVTVMKAHKAHGGEFEHGKVAISISESERSNPKWKEAAITAAKRVAELEGREWDEAEYVKEVQKDAATSEATTVKLTVSD
jgi:hypothetical protein